MNTFYPYLLFFAYKSKPKDYLKRSGLENSTTQITCIVSSSQTECRHLSGLNVVSVLQQATLLKCYLIVACQAQTCLHLSADFLLHKLGGSSMTSNPYIIFYLIVRQKFNILGRKYRNSNGKCHVIFFVSLVFFYFEN